MDSFLQIHSIIITIICLVLGSLLLITNLPVLYAILGSSKLRMQYANLALLLLAAVSGGFNCFLRAFSIISELQDENNCNDTNESIVTSKRPWNCLGPMASHCELFSFLLLPISLLMCSTDRLLVIYNPIGYFLHLKLYVIAQLVIAGLFQIGLMVYVMLAKFYLQFAADKCKCYVMMSRGTFFFLLYARMCTSIISILIMLIVLIKFRQVRKGIVNKDRRLVSFNSRQQGFTKAMLLCCCFTFVFFFLPNMAAYCTRMLGIKNADLYNAYLKLVSYTSTLDILAIMLYRLQDITAAVLQRFPFLFYFRIFLQPTILTTEVKTMQTLNINRIRISQKPADPF